MTVSHAIVILITLTCQLAPKSNSHISQSFVASVYKPASFQCLSIQIFNFVQQCIQISTRINSSSVHTYILRLFYIASSIRIFILINPIIQHIPSATVALCWGGVSTPPFSRRPLGAGTPWSRHPLGSRHPPGSRHNPWEQAQPLGAGSPQADLPQLPTWLTARETCKACWDTTS